MEQNELLCNEEFIVKSTSPIKIKELRHEHGYDQEEKDPVFAEIDEKILKDSRVLKNLIHHESACIPATKDYLRYHQTKLDPTMRKIVVRWMLEVTQDSRSQPDVFLLSVNVLDRFLSVCPQIDKNKLQLIATTALLVSSKFKDTTPFSGEKLIFYTDDSVTPAELRHWELLLLRTLSWDLATVTPIDFMDHIFLRIRLEDSISKVQMTEVRNRIETILVLAATEYVFSYVNPSLLAASAIHLVISRFNCNDDIDPRLCKCILALPDDVERCVTTLEKVVPNYLLRFSGIDTTQITSNSHSDYGSADLPNEMNDSCILVS